MTKVGSPGSIPPSGGGGADAPDLVLEFERFLRDVSEFLGKSRGETPQPPPPQDHFDVEAAPGLFPAEPASPVAEPIPEVGRPPAEDEPLSRSDRRRERRSERRKLIDAAAGEVVESRRRKTSGPGELRSDELGGQLVSASMLRYGRLREERLNNNNWFRDHLLRNDYEREDDDWRMNPASPEYAERADDTRRMDDEFDRKREIEKLAEERELGKREEQDREVRDLEERRIRARMEEADQERRLEFRRSEERRKDNHEFDRDYGRKQGWPDDEY